MSKKKKTWLVVYRNADGEVHAGPWRFDDPLEAEMCATDELERMATRIAKGTFEGSPPEVGIAWMYTPDAHVVGWHRAEDLMREE